MLRRLEWSHSFWPPEACGPLNTASCSSLKHHSSFLAQGFAPKYTQVLQWSGLTSSVWVGSVLMRLSQTMPFALEYTKHIQKLAGGGLNPPSSAASPRFYVGPSSLEGMHPCLGRVEPTGDGLFKGNGWVEKKAEWRKVFSFLMLIKARWKAVINFSGLWIQSGKKHVPLSLKKAPMPKTEWICNTPFSPPFLTS